MITHEGMEGAASGNKLLSKERGATQQADSWSTVRGYDFRYGSVIGSKPA